MTALEETIVGPPVTVKLGGKEYPLAYPMQAIIIYKIETAKVDRRRTEDRPRLERELVRKMRRDRKELLRRSQELFAKKDKTPEEQEEFEWLRSEASAIKRELDEDAGNGDSLFDLYNWDKISPEEDPQRLLLALWVGLHYFDEARVYVPALTVQQLGPLITPGNASELLLAVSQALSQHILSQREPEVPDPNAQTPELPALTDPPPEMTRPTMKPKARH
jgi:hypothetical protein